YAEAFYQTGETLLRMEKYKEALVEYRQAAVLKPNYFDAFFGLGSAYFEIDDYVEAEKAYKQAVRLKNDSIEAYINLADSQRLQAKYNDAESNYNLATSFIQRKSDYSPDEAADVYSKIGFVISKQCAINARSGIPCRWDTAVSALEKAAAITGNTVDTANLGWAYYNSARTDIVAKRDPALVRSKLEKAKASLEKAAFSSPKFIEGPLLNLGMTLTDLGDYAGAVDALKRVVDKQPKWVFAINELGIAYRKQKNYKEAMSWFKKATERDDKYVQAHYNFAEAAFQNGDLNEAQKAYNKVKQLRRPDLAGQLELISGGKLRG
ncbi:MAG: tetratricopeptide repeat protein, partial [Acidobacteriota bacterium]